jgi:hypothetical protein
MTGREDCFIEGEVLETNNTEHGYQAYKIRVTRDVFDGKEFDELAYKEVEKHRVVMLCSYHGKLVSWNIKVVLSTCQNKE